MSFASKIVSDRLIAPAKAALQRALEGLLPWIYASMATRRLIGLLVRPFPAFEGKLLRFARARGYRVGVRGPLKSPLMMPDPKALADWMSLLETSQTSRGGANS